MIERKSLAWFLPLAFGISWLLFVLPLLIAPQGSNARQSAALVAWSLAMWGPGLAAIIATRVAAGESLSRLNLGRLGPKRPYLWAWLLPPALAAVTGLLTWALGAGRVDLTFSLIREAIAQAPGGQAVPAAVVVAVQVVFALTLAPFVNILLAMGEELGWRGFLLPHLLPLGQWRAILLSSAIWGIWHAPVILQGHNYPTRPVLGVFMMIVVSLLVGTIFSWLDLQTGSPWAPALAHGSLNATAGLPLLLLTDVDISVGGTVSSLIGWIGLALVVGWLVRSGRLPVQRRSEMEQRQREPLQM